MSKLSVIYRLVFLVFFAFLSLPINAESVEIAPRISDREIIESLAQLKEGQKQLNIRFNDMRTEIKTDIDGLRREVNTQSNQANQRMDRMHTTMLTLFGALVTLIVALFGYIAWDRRTMMKPFQERLESLEKELHRDLDLQHPDGSRITRMLHALRELAKQDEKVATILRSFSLL
ncbi:MAG: hypothetical protein HQL54_12055 [Magnetococcales bacterium]|nr:hypothetical protein [Magnetococcales bacterium]